VEMVSILLDGGKKNNKEKRTEKEKKEKKEARQEEGKVKYWHTGNTF
jgi:hypothetical protein